MRMINSKKMSIFVITDSKSECTIVFSENTDSIPLSVLSFSNCRSDFQNVFISELLSPEDPPGVIASWHEDIKLFIESQFAKINEKSLLKRKVSCGC
jgi:hypothetical protein